MRPWKLLGAALLGLASASSQAVTCSYAGDLVPLSGSITFSEVSLAPGELSACRSFSLVGDVGSTYSIWGLIAPFGGPNMTGVTEVTLSSGLNFSSTVVSPSNAVLYSTNSPGLYEFLVLGSVPDDNSFGGYSVTLLATPDQAPTTSVPELGSSALMLAGLLTFLSLRRRSGYS